MLLRRKLFHLHANPEFDIKIDISIRSVFATIAVVKQLTYHAYKCSSNGFTINLIIQLIKYWHI